MCAMLLSANLTIVTGTLLFFAVSVLLVAILLLAKKYLVPTGNVKINNMIAKIFFILKKL